MLIQNSRILLSNNIDVIFKTFWGNYSGYLKENSKIRCLVINTYLPWNFKTCEIKCYQNVKKKMWKKLLLYAVKIFKFQNPQCTCNTNKYKLIISLDSTCLHVIYSHLHLQSFTCSRNLVPFTVYPLPFIGTSLN